MSSPTSEGRSALAAVARFLDAHATGRLLLSSLTSTVSRLLAFLAAANDPAPHLPLGPLTPWGQALPATCARLTADGVLRLTRAYAAVDFALRGAADAACEAAEGAAAWEARGGEGGARTPSKPVLPRDWVAYTAAARTALVWELPEVDAASSSVAEAAALAAAVLRGEGKGGGVQVHELVAPTGPAWEDLRAAAWRVQG